MASPNIERNQACKPLLPSHRRACALEHCGRQVAAVGDELLQRGAWHRTEFGFGLADVSDELGILGHGLEGFAQSGDALIKKEPAGGRLVLIRGC